MIYITGDKHGSPAAYEQIISQIENPSEDDVIVVCGDAGLEYGDYNMGSCRKIMKKFPGSWFILRGNHDTRYWRDHLWEEGWSVSYKFGRPSLMQRKYPNIFYAADGGDVYSIGKYVFLVIPGAYSVDKYYRLNNSLSFEPEEQLTQEEKKKLEILATLYQDRIDFVCGHTFPRKIEPSLEYLFMEGIDQSRVDKSMEDFLNEIMEIVEEGPRFKQYFGAHYHDDKVLNDKYTILYNAVAEAEAYDGEQV